jgi:uncharacterized membrane protein
MMVDVVTEVLISAPKAKVAEFASEPDNAPAWYKNIKSVKWITEKPLSLHSRIAFEANFLGKKLSYIYEITEWIPGEKLVMRTAEGPFPMETTYEWTAINPGSTKMTLRNRGNPSGFSKIIAPFMSLAMKNANNKDLKQLKFLIEEKKV